MEAERALSQACAAVIGLVLAGTAGSSGQLKPESRVLVVTIENMRFNPEVLILKSGDRITWTNKDLFPHTATADAKTFDSHSIAPTGSWTLVTGEPGTYAYSCAFHPTMKGTLKVQ
jgi:plastocyanin